MKLNRSKLEEKSGRSVHLWAVSSLAALLLVAWPARATSIAEPSTVFYGKIWAAGGANPYLVSTGELRWIIREADGTEVRLRTRLAPLNGGEFSYRLDVPHEALALGLSSSSNSVPLSALAQTHSHFQITVDGEPAQILGPSGTSFDVAQAYRAATYRLDLAVGLGASDVDGNGLADWWQSRYGLNDPLADPDGDGLNNLAEYRRGTDPKHDDRIPSLATRELRVHADGTTAVRLRAIDADSPAASLIYTLTRAPQQGGLRLRNVTASPGGADQALAAGASFSQADVLRSKVIFVAAASSALQTSFEVVLRDENGSHPPSTNVVNLAFYRPSEEADSPLVMAHLLGTQSGYVISDSYGEGLAEEIAVPSSGLSRAAYDAQYVPGYGPDRHHVLLGSLASDRLEGGMEDDVIVGSRGNDILRGNGGADLFLLTGPEDGSDVIEDFNVAEGDTIDISRALVGASLQLSDYVALANSTLRINPSGTGTANATLELTLAGASLPSLFDLVESGRLVTGDKALPPRVTLIAHAPAASENGPTTGGFTLSRSGSAAAALTVHLQVTGSAANGVDYVFINSQARFLPGERSLTIEVTPYVDAITELSEVVQLSVLSGDGYTLGAPATAQVSIEDLLPQISIEALESIAVKSDQTPGIFVVTRAGVLDRGLLVRLEIGGTASSTDYSGVPSFVNLAPWQTAAVITITPRPTAVLANGVEFVQLSLRPDAAYRVISPSTARVLLVEEQMTFGLWRDRFFAGTTGDLFAFAMQDPGQTGIRSLQRYAFGLDAHAPQQSPGKPLFRVQDNHLTVEFRRPAAITDVEYAVEISEDLVTWHSSDGYVEPVAAPELANQPETLCYRVKRSISESQTMFMRVRVVYAP